MAATDGTATLEETAYFQNLTARSRKPVVVTGAMRPPTAWGTGADVNLLDGIKVAGCPHSAGKGVKSIPIGLNAGKDVGVHFPTLHDQLDATLVL